MSTFKVESGSSKNMTASGQVTPCAGALIGFRVNSTSSGTIELYDGNAFGRALSGTITPTVGFHRFPATFDNGLYAYIGGTIDVTFMFAAMSAGGDAGSAPETSFSLDLDDAGNGSVNLAATGMGDVTPTFTRATDATTVDENGLIVTVTSGTPRSYYDPATLQYRGYLAEGARTNTLVRSGWQGAVAGSPGTAPTGWTLTSITGTQTLSLPTSIYGTADGTQALNFQSDGGRLYLEQVVTLVNGTSYTLSSYLESLTGNIGRVFNISAGTGTVDSGLGPIPSATGRVSFTFTCTSSGTVTIRVGVGTTGAVTGLVSATMSRPQLEAGTFPSTYIPTEGSAVTRNADVLTYPFSGNADATVGTAYAELSTLWGNTTGINFQAVAYDTPVNSSLLAGISGAVSTAIRAYDGVTVITKTGLSNMQTGVRKRAVAYGNSTFSITGDGAAVASGVFDNSIGNAAVAIGCSSSGLQPWFGTIKNVRIWKNQFTAAQLSAITSG